MPLSSPFWQKVSIDHNLSIKPFDLIVAIDKNKLLEKAIISKKNTKDSDNALSGNYPWTYNNYRDEILDQPRGKHNPLTRIQIHNNQKVNLVNF